MKPWQAPIPKIPKRKHQKRCYEVWTQYNDQLYMSYDIVWLTDKQLTFAKMKDPELRFIEVLEKDL